MAEIPGYTFGSPTLPRSPITLEELQDIQRSLTFSPEDKEALRKAGDILEDQVDAILDVWYGFVGATPHLVAYFAGADGQPLGDYLQKVRARFGQWILDTCRRPYDQAWLDYQLEIGRRHHRTGKNRTDGVQAVPHIHFRHLVALTYPIFATLKPFLEKKGASGEEVEKMHQAWLKAVLLQVILWSYPYLREGDF
ncbi:MAG: protoglobin domain-containing protein [Bacillota bacterium]|nr:protoglobin domain-containing protein [Bacillota bacterium]